MSFVHRILVLFAVILIVQIAESHFLGGFGYPGYYGYPRYGGFGGGYGGGFRVGFGYRFGGGFGGYGRGFYPRPLPPPIFWG